MMKVFVKDNFRLALLVLLDKICFLIPDKSYLQWRYYLSFSRKLDLKNPRTFSEKLQWLKLYNRRMEYTRMVDKVEAKKYVSELLGEKYVIPTLGVWDDPDDINFDALPEQFVLKCNHNSGLGMCVCRDKSRLNISKVKDKLRKGLKQNYYLHGREWPYKNVPRKILAEKFMVDGVSENLTDYKFFCFDGEPFMMYVSKDNAEHTTTDFFDMEYNRLPIRMKDPNSDCPPEKPEEFEQMCALSKVLSKGIPHLRVDFYCINHQIYVGEMTFYHNSGFGPINPEEWNLKLGSLIKIE
ncbi:ATP-grasp fold amidoligase family protein [Bacteroides fragilis]|uniref:ATP-grasp fold amidoligase family protein n=1 Tax=Bacteroides fragilis TaxID=817 RepID=UPI0032DA22A5